jgi:hypothetical protein
MLASDAHLFDAGSLPPPAARANNRTAGEASKLIERRGP